MNVSRILSLKIRIKCLQTAARNASVLTNNTFKLDLMNGLLSNRKVFSFNNKELTGVLLSRFASASTENSGGSVDAENLKKFQEMSNSWWVEDGEFEPLHRMNELRVPLIRDTLLNYRKNVLDKSGEKYTAEELAREPLIGLNVLDVGCGGGILCEPLARLGANVTGIDACRENIIAAQMRIESELEKSNGAASFYQRIRYLNCTIEDLAAVDENSGYFDAVVMSEVVEHVNNVNEFLVNSTKLLKNHGFSFVTTINKTTQSYLLAILAAEYVLGLVPKGTHVWDKFISPEEVKKVLEKNEVFVKFKMGLCYNFLTKTWSWSDDDSVNYAMYAQKFVTTP